MSPDFPLELTGFFQGKHLTHFLVLKMKDFRSIINKQTNKQTFQNLS